MNNPEARARRTDFRMFLQHDQSSVQPQQARTQSRSLPNVVLRLVVVVVGDETLAPFK